MQNKEGLPWQAALPLSAVVRHCRRIIASAVDPAPRRRASGRAHLDRGEDPAGCRRPRHETM